MVYLARSAGTADVKHMDLSSDDDGGETNVDDMPVLEPPPVDPKVAAFEAKEAGNVLFKQGKFIASIAQYSTAIALDRQAPYLGNRAAAHMMLNSFADALEDTLAANKLEPGQVKHLVRAAKCALSLGKYSEAERYYGQVQELEPANATAAQELRNLAALHDLTRNAEQAVASNLFNNALSLLDRALELAPSDDALKLRKGDVFLRQKRYGETERIVAGILRQNQTNSAALCLRGRMFYEQGELDKAVDHFQRALRSDPDHSASRVELKKAKALLLAKDAGTAAFKAGRLDEAVELYTQALLVDTENQPTLSKLHFNRAVVFHKLKRYGEAIADCTTALDLDDSYVKALTKRAQIKLDSEEFDAAIADYESAAEKDPTNDDIKRDLKKAKIELKKSKRKNYYKILGVAKDADENEIKRAYKKMALQHHPDRCQGDEAAKEAAESKFKDLGEAYGVLSDSGKRERYDQGQDLEEINGGGHGHGHGHGGFPGGINPDMFAQMFGGGGRGGFHFG